jgi:hypothetical protein
VAATVLEALRLFLPDFLKSAPSLSAEQRRALWALDHCRTPALGGRAFACTTPNCSRQIHFAWHSCNHKACPQCGRAATARWVQRELAKRVQAPYFLVTFTLPAQLRGCFFGPHAKQFFDLFFTAVARALSEKLVADKNLRAAVHGFTAMLHTWNQQLGLLRLLSSDGQSQPPAGAVAQRWPRPTGRQRSARFTSADTAAVSSLPTTPATAGPRPLALQNARTSPSHPRHPADHGMKSALAKNPGLGRAILLSVRGKTPFRGAILRPGGGTSPDPGGGPFLGPAPWDAAMARPART